MYIVYVAPAVLTGEATWLGYNFVNDTASNFLLTELLGSQGAAAPSDQTGGANIARYLIGIGYPLGAFSTRVERR